MRLRVAVLLGVTCLCLAAWVFANEPIANWAAPATWSPVRGAGVHTLSDATPPLPFIGLPPCRLVDTRGTAGIPINTGGAFAANETRTWTLTGLCGLPAAVGAVSLNFTVVATQSNPFGYLSAAPGGTPPPATTSILNWQAANVQESNASIVPLSVSGQIAVETFNAGAQVLVDVNGYYASTPATSSNYFSVVGTGLYAIYGQTSNPSGNAAAIYGLETAGASTGVWGDTSSNSDLCAGVFGRATSTLGETFGVWGRTHSAGPYATGTYGETMRTTGITYGVYGLTRSPDNGAAGVYGVQGTDIAATSFFSAGVRGASVNNFGVLGISRFVGVFGAYMDSTGFTQAGGYLGYSSSEGVHAQGTITATGMKSFIEPHPTDATKEITYVALEGPEAGTYFRGRGRIHNGTGVISVPESFRLVSDEEGLSVQITPIGQTANVAVASFDLNTVVVKSAVKELDFFYLVNGVRKAFNDWEAIGVNKHYVPDGPTARMPGAFAPEQRRSLIATGIYNEDGTVNMETAERLGWTKTWADREERAKAAAREASRFDRRSDK